MYVSMYVCMYVINQNIFKSSITPPLLKIQGDGREQQPTVRGMKRIIETEDRHRFRFIRLERYH